MKRPEAVECRSCKALMFWVVTKHGKSMPVDAKPDPNGGLVLTLKAEDGKLHAEAYMKTEPTHQSRNRYTSHFSTCPSAGQHRRKT